PALELLRETGLKTLEQVERSAAIIRRLRDYISVGRLEVGAHQAGAIISECIELMRPEFDRSGTALEVYVPAPLPPLSVDRLQIETVLTNLLRNAVEAIEAEQPEAPHISISAIHILSGFVEIAVADNGIGFPSGFRLSRAGPIASTKAEGLGIGLSLCQSIIESHGGRIEIDRRSGGATVRMTLPVAGGPAHA
ncbi:MAG TPA: ATP-binding protein, partial [Hyphomicrobiaceae bacterium]|nr:ATP-binding protein [Hyphomicrobiaceae bacterium]